MLTTDYFRQLCPAPLYRIRNQYRFMARKYLPIGLGFLISNGVEPERVAPLAALTRGERVRETMLVQKLLEYIFEGEPFTARCAIDCWISRRGGCPAELDAAARAFADDLIERDWATSVSCDVAGSKNLLSPVNDKRYQVREPR